VVKIQRLAPVTGNAASGCRGTAFDSKPPSPLALAKLQNKVYPDSWIVRKMCCHGADYGFVFKP
jgi:hypothetical protein